MVELLLKKGEIVVATARKPEVLADLQAKYPATQLITAKLDVDNVQQIKDAFAKAAVHTRGRGAVAMYARVRR